jgi:hypothetical protein
MLGTQVRGADATSKHRQFLDLGAVTQLQRPRSTHDCGIDFGYAKFMHIATAFTRVQCNMNFFPSSRKVFAPL